LVSSSFIGDVLSEKNEKESCTVDRVDVHVNFDRVDVENVKIIEEKKACLLQNPIDLVRNTIKRDLSFQSFEEINGEPKNIKN
jgi:hypothetical protein